MQLIQDYQITDPAALSAIRSIRSFGLGVICREYGPIKEGDATLYEVQARRGSLPVYGARTASLLDSALTVAQKVTDWRAA